MKFQFIDVAKENFPVTRLCHVLGVSPSGYFAWRSRPASPRQREDLVLLAHIRSAFTLSNETYGSPRMTRELQDEGLTMGRRRTARLMRENGLKARQKRKVQAHHRQPSCLSDCAQPARAGLLSHTPEPEVERGYLVRVDGRRLVVSGRGPRSLRPPGGWLGGE
jgi:transposase InsO family protein